MAGRLTREYRIPVEQVLTRLMLKHPELRLLDNRKSLVLYAWRAYAPLFNEACNREPILVEQLLLQAPDTDTILRTARRLQNDDHRLVDPDRAVMDLLKDLGAKQLEDFD